MFFELICTTVLLNLVVFLWFKYLVSKYLKTLYKLGEAMDKRPFSSQSEWESYRLLVQDVIRTYNRAVEYGAAIYDKGFLDELHELLNDGPPQYPPAAPKSGSSFFMLGCFHEISW